MTREKFDALCRDCCRQSGLSECLFADAEVGFIDTSAECDGSRGIAFSKRKMMVNFDGTVKNVAYCKIRSVQIISSQEDAFADELEISGEHSRLRISDFSVDKHKLKQLIEGLCEGIEDAPAEEKTAAAAAENRAEKAAETVEEAAGMVEKAAVTVKVKPAEKAAVTAEKSAANSGEIPEKVEGKVGEKTVENAAETAGKTVAEVTDKAAVTVGKSAANLGETPEKVEGKVVEYTVEKSVETAGKTVAEVTEKAAVTVGKAAANSGETPEKVEEKVVEKTVEKAVKTAGKTVAEVVEKAAETVGKSAANSGEIPEKVEGKVGENTVENAAETAEKTVAEVTEKAPEIVEEVVEKSEEPVLSHENEIHVIAEQPASEHFPVGEIEWLNGAVKTEEKPVEEEKIEWLSGMSDDEKPPEIPENPTNSEAADRELIEQMSREETLDFLSKTLSEINDEPVFEEQTEIVVKPDTNALLVSDFAENLPEDKAPEKSGGLSKEPVWGDIYIKASRSLRELCESGKLSMDVIENELREKLLGSAKAFAQIIAAEQKMPKTLIPKIAELKNAAGNFDEYFAYGEDVGVRVMFFMLYQMLSYADRIAENPDTKERLNDFFRRFGTAGITLSMLDVRG